MAKFFSMIIGLTHLHSSFRYVVLLLLVLAIIDAVISIAGDKTYRKQSKMLALFALIFSHIQLLMGSVLYFLGNRGAFASLLEGASTMSNPEARFFAVEHMLAMIVAIALITVGYSRSKKQEVDKKKYASILMFYSIALLLIFVMIPWPFMKDFGRWF